jgi:hypothetical protein
MLAAEPSNEVPIVEVEGDEGLAQKFGSLVNRECVVVGVVPRQAKHMQWCPRQLHAKDCARLEWGHNDG